MDKLKLAASAFAPWTFLSSDDKYDCEGVGCHLVKYIARSMNFTLELVFQKVVGTGSQLPDGKLDWIDWPYTAWCKWLK